MSLLITDSLNLMMDVIWEKSAMETGPWRHFRYSPNISSTALKMSKRHSVRPRQYFTTNIQREAQFEVKAMLEWPDFNPNLCKNKVYKNENVSCIGGENRTRVKRRTVCGSAEIQSCWQFFEGLLTTLFRNSTYSVKTSAFVFSVSPPVIAADVDVGE